MTDLNLLSVRLVLIRVSFDLVTFCRQQLYALNQCGDLEISMHLGPKFHSRLACNIKTLCDQKFMLVILLKATHAWLQG